MSDYHIAKRRFVEGVWEGIVTRKRADSPAPRVEVTHQGRALPEVKLTESPDGGHWDLTVPVPANMLGDGAQVFLINDAASGDLLDSFAIIAGEVLADDLHAELQLLRDELDMLKRAFRRHCLDTG
ncbi:hypothetical protein [Primorskyibacter flagellatus]|uniref:Uncharacterized protein n=1 Tax=Primorskyibacter flagellatus TaxID=1387277 RepID=A0A1W1ZXD6_9RHOB|nr:hypothetical protein [Primorskyibacter flagellatus]SMC53077.1 hypothetical protein SAMN06295998_102224 [Primorskyibacter flagellatus]